ncbi:ATP synthase F1 subunit delta [Pelagibacterales bacterium SAG-MED20]|nr:ATP synthase F1 subunit delta [Pelagibacterales bacterium SAG-MED20]
MSKNKGFSETSAGRYSLALYELAAEGKMLSEIEVHSASIIDLISSSAHFKSLIKNPTNNKKDQLNALNKISEQYKLNELLTKFLSFLISKRRFFYVDKILKSFVETCSIKRGELKAELTSAKDLTENEVNNIKEELTKNFSSKIKLNYKHDASLIGGLIVQVGSTMVDTSIKNKLKQIENRMTEA